MGPLGVLEVGGVSFAVGRVLVEVRVPKYKVSTQNHGYDS